MTHTATADLVVPEGIDPADVLAALKELVPATRAEPGCLRFDIHQDRADPRHFVLWESFADDTAFQTHLEAPHTRAYFALAYTQVRAFWHTDLVI